MPGFYSDLQNDAEYVSLPDRIDEEILERRVRALRLGDYTQVNPISVQLLRLAMSLIANFAHPRRTPDLIGVGLLTLVESVREAANALEDNNIIPYVSSSINWRLRDAVADDHVVRIPSRTLRSLRKKGIEVQLYINKQSSEDSPSDEENGERTVRKAYYNPVIAKPDRPSIECREMLEKIVRSDREKLVLDMRAERYGLEAIAKAAGVSIGLIHKIKEDLKARYAEIDKD